MKKMFHKNHGPVELLSELGKHTTKNPDGTETPGRTLVKKIKDGKVIEATTAYLTPLKEHPAEA